MMNTIEDAPVTRYKFLRLEGRRIRSQSGDCQWEVNQWKRLPDGHALICCASGYHCSVQPYDALRYVRGEIVATVETAGRCTNDGDGDKECWQEMRLLKVYRWQKVDFVALAVFAAELVLPLYEKRHPDDKRPREAIGAARQWIADPSSTNAAYAAAYAAAAYAAYAAADADADAYAYAYAYAGAYAAARKEVYAKINAWMVERIAGLPEFERPELVEAK